MNDKEDVSQENVFNILVLGMIAKQYAAASKDAPVRFWGQEIGSNSIPHKGDSYSFGIQRKGDRIGVTMTVVKGAYNGGTERESKWVPVEALNAVTTLIPWEPI